MATHIQLATLIVVIAWWSKDLFIIFISIFDVFLVLLIIIDLRSFPQRKKKLGTS
jgi:uncharacterized membrane protein